MLSCSVQVKAAVMAYDDLIRKVDGARFRWKLFIIFFVNGFPNGLFLASLTYTQYLPESYRCKLSEPVEEFVKNNYSGSKSLLDFMIPKDTLTGEPSMCFLYNRSSLDVKSLMNQSIDVSEWNVTDSEILPCNEGYLFQDPYGIYSASKEFEWICDNKWIRPVVTSLFVAGIGVGSCSGFLSDRFGRRSMFLSFTLLQFAFMFVQSFSTSSWMYAIIQLLVGCCSMVNYVVGFVIGTECTVPEKRNFLSIGSFVSFSISFAIASAVAHFIVNWRWLLRAFCAIGTIYISNYWLVPESPRWLMANGRVREAKEVFKEMAKCNSKQANIDELMEKIEEETKKLIEEEKRTVAIGKSSMLNFLKRVGRSSKLFMMLITMSFSWFCICFVYYGISLNVDALSGNLYLNGALVGLVEIPGHILAYLAVKYVSRPLTQGGFMVTSGMFCMGAALISSVDTTAASVAALIGKSLNSGAFYVIFIHTTESFPTLVRNSCVSIGSIFGRVGSVISPYTMALGGMHTPYLVMSLLTVASGVLTFWFSPETRLVELPENTEDTLNLKTNFDRCWGLFKKTRHKESKDDSEKESFKI